jgi:phage host-nuclease inhibitor protein Gam
MVLTIRGRPQPEKSGMEGGEGGSLKGRSPKFMEQKKDRRAVGVKVLPEGIEEYCERHTTALTELHEQLLRETEEKTTTANFLVGEIEGAFLKMIVRMTQAKKNS